MRRERPGSAPRTAAALFTHGMPGLPRPFTGLTAAHDGSLLLAGDGEGTVLRLTARDGRTSEAGEG